MIKKTHSFGSANATLIKLHLNCTLRPLTRFEKIYRAMGLTLTKLLMKYVIKAFIVRLVVGFFRQGAVVFSLCSAAIITF